MRSAWIIYLALGSLATGCATSSTDTPLGQYGHNGAAQQSWTQKVTAPITSAFASNDSKSATKPGPDELSLQFQTSKPSASLYVSMARLSDQGNNTENARSLYRKALEMEPQNIDASLGLARMEDRHGNFSVALEVYRQALAAHPQDTRVLNDLALCHARNGQMQEAAQLLHRAVTLRPEKELYRNNFAKVWIEMNRLDLALAHMEAVYPKPVASYNVGLLLVERGRQAEAGVYLAKALELDPQMAAAQNLLTKISGPPRSQQQVASSGLVISAPQPTNALANRPTQDESVLPTPQVVGGQVPTYPNTGVPAMIPEPVFPTETASNLSSHEMLMDLPQVK